MKTIEKLFIGIILLLIFGVFVFGSQFGTLFIIFNFFYRKVILKMTPSDSKLYSNFMMFDKIDDYKSLKKNENYEKAIRAIKEALLYGKKWVENDTLQYQEFSGVYEFLSDVYIDNGNYFYIKNDFKKALLNYIRADSILTHKEFVPKYPKVIKSDVYWNRYNMMLTYDKLLDYENYDIELDYLLDNYSKIKDTIE